MIIIVKYYIHTFKCQYINQYLQLNDIFNLVFKLLIKIKDTLLI